MNTEKLFVLEPDNIRYMATTDNAAVRVWVRLARDGCVAEATVERNDPISAVTAALGRALERWLDEGCVSAVPNGSALPTPEGWLYRTSVFARTTSGFAGGRLDSAEATHPDIIKAAGLAYIAAVNKLIGVLGFDTLVTTGHQATHPA